MNTAIPSQAVVAIATVIAALITGVIAIVNLTLSKEQKISEMRQAWIDGLRDDLAQFFSGVRYVATAVSQHFDEQNHGKKFSHDFSEEQVTEKISVINETLYRIKLRLNPEEPEHIELERLLNSVLSCYRDGKDGDPAMLENVRNASELSTNFARIVLKAEWKRVKRGEDAYNNLRRWIVPTVVLLMSIFIAVILRANFT
jgi:hypothetical protein